jgi:RNA polymerase sigma-70 factor (ECF subfamily)
LADNNLKIFEKLFRELFKPLCGFAMKYTNDVDDAKGVVHEVFVIVWEKFGTLPIDTNYRSYLYTAVRNRCLNFIRDKKKHVTLEKVAEHQAMETNTTLETLELERQITFAIESLPEKCRMVFELNRLEGLKYAQIAEKMQISVKTVEAQMSKALSVLRVHLAEFLTLIFFLMST